MANEKNKSQVPVAVVYVVTLLISLVIFGVLALILGNKFVKTDVKDDSSEFTSASFTAADNVTTLYALTDANNELDSAFISKFVPSKGRIICVPLTAYLDVDGKTIKDIYSSGGIVAMSGKVERKLGIEIDKYMTLSYKSFESVFDIMSPALFTLTEDVTFKDATSGESTSYDMGSKISVDGKTALALVTYREYSGKNATNPKISGELVATIINTFFEQKAVAVGNVDNIFSKQYDQGDTNITIDDYNSQKNAIVYMIENTRSPAYALTPTGTWSEETRFIIDEAYVEQLKIVFQD